jgi:nucleoside-diphosphate-sugar epimerase
VRLLVLGGTRFLGRAVADAALTAGHELTLFNRGETNAGLFPQAEHLRGDRDGGLAALDGRQWDAVVDTCGYFPRIVRQTVETLAETVGRYCFVSSVSVYADFSAPLDEDSPVGTIDDGAPEEFGAEHERYGPFKALCERAVEETYGGRALIVRPGLIVGRHDPTGRFTYWPHRLARGGEVLAPGPPERLAQFIDVRDLAEWIVRALEEDRGGVFNATGQGVSWATLLADAHVTWVGDEFLVAHEVGEWMELPLWIGDPAWAAMHQTDVSRAVAAGLRFRSLEDTLRDTLSLAQPVEGVGLTAVREAELLAAWHGR